MRSATLTLVLFLTASSSVVAKRDVFAIALPKHEPLRFIVAGDAGTGDAHLHAGIVAITKRMPIDAILLVGDNVYPCGVNSVDDPQWSKVNINFADAGVPIYPILGNHDYGDPVTIGGKRVTCGQPSPQAEVDATGKIPHWIFPARNYALRSSIADFIMVDTQPLASEFENPYLGSETMNGELDWVTSALDEAGDGWRIVVGHHTIYSSGLHGYKNHWDQRNMRETLLPLLREKHVDLYICGHDHDAELIGRVSERPMYLVAGDGAHSDIMRQRHKKDEPPTTFPTSFPPKPLVGFNLLEIASNKISITFYDGIGNQRSGTYTITR